jgi:hypothetical protein
LCFYCPSGSKCSINQVESEELYSNIENKLSDQPDVYQTKEDEAESYNFISYIVIAPVTLLLIFLFLFFRICNIIQKVNIYKSQDDSDPNTIKIAIGVIASYLFFGITAILIVDMSLVYFLDNITETKALVPLVSIEEEYGSVTSI